MKIIIADDNTRECTVIKRIITEYFPQHTIDGIFENGIALMDYLEKHVPDLMITDIVMPGFDGLDACKKLREKSAKAHIILITAHQKFEYAKRAIPYHVDELVVKPYTTNQLVDAISSALSVNIQNIAANFADALKDVSVDSFIDKNIATLSSLSIMQILEVLSQVNYLLNTDISIDESTTDDWLSCFNNYAGAYYQYSPRKFTVQEAKKYIQNNYSNPSLSRTLIAEHLGVNEQHLSEIFKVEYNIGISTYITQVRVNAAKELLANSSMSIQDISIAIGCNSTKYFYQIFKKVTNLTPAQYQMRKRLNEDKT